MAKVDNYTLDAATRARKAKVLIAATLNNSNLEPEAVRMLEHAYRLIGDVTDTLLRNDETTRSEVMAINSLKQVNSPYCNEAPGNNEIRTWRDNPANI